MEGKIYEAVSRAQALGCNTMQIFSRNPRQWRQTELSSEDIKEFKNRVKKAKITPVFVHIPYSINLASADKELYNRSIEIYIQDINEAGLLEAEYLVTHMGSHKETGEKEGLKRFSKALDIILAHTDKAVTVLLENTSGSGSWLGYKFEHQKIVLETIKNPKRVGICLDTCHAYTAGYDVATRKGLEETVAEIQNLIGLAKLKLIHLNDTQDKLASHRDRHAHIGEGNIGRAGFRRIVHHPKLKNIPFILETPKKSDEDDLKNLKIIRSL